MSWAIPLVSKTPWNEPDSLAIVARRDITMTADEVAAFLEAGTKLQVATIGRDGFPHLASMWYLLRDGDVWFRSFTKSQKIVNLTRNPRLTVLVERGEAYSDLQGVMIKGRAELSNDRSTVLGLYGGLAAKYPMINDAVFPDLDGAGLEAMFGRFADKNTGVRVIAERVISWDHRKIGGGY